MRTYPAIIGLCFICCLVPSANASAPITATYWERGSAMAAAQSVNIDRAVYEIGDISSLADGKATLRHLHDLETRDDWPEPARDAAIYTFARSLAELPRDAVAAEVMQYLMNYQPLTLVPHEEHAEAYVPLFNIRSAAGGVENAWQRAEFAIEAQALIATSPSRLVATYATSSNHNQRAAYLDALRQGGMAEVIRVQDIALKQLAETPALTALIGVTAAITADTHAVQQLLINGSGTGLAAALAQLDSQLPDSETIDLLAFAIEQAPASNATLAIAAWWPRLRHDARARDLLVALLANPALGSSAALALAQGPDIQTIKILQDTASGESTAARRAQMALDINRDQLTGERQP